MRRLIAPEDMLSCEKKFFAESGVPSISVMETAAAALADAALSRFPDAKKIFIACGPGGNGGDGYACARLLQNAGKECEIYASAPAKSPDAMENCRRAEEMGIPVYLEELPDTRPDLWIDCLYGTGLSREPSGRSAELIELMNAHHRRDSRLLACDIPSGLNGRTGKAYDPSVQADMTVTFQLAKFGHYLQDGLDVCGELIVADVGFPEDAFSLYYGLTENVYLADTITNGFTLPSRKRNSYKGSYGHLLIVAGSFGMAGAAALCAKAALRSGVGLVTICCPEEIIPILQVHAPQAMCTPLSIDNLKKVLPGKTAIAIGPGLTRNIDPEILKIVLESGLPAAIDADALNILSEHPELKSPLSPTQRVGGMVQDEFKKITHKRMMLSLSNAFNDEELEDFDEKIKEVLVTENEIEYICELKIDGLAMSIEYENGKIRYAATRGNGVEGEEVTHNIKTIKSIPLKVDDDRVFEVRGEVYMPKKSFYKLNEKRKENGEALFANPRNAASGSVRQMDSKIAASRGLDMFIYTYVDCENFGFNKQSEALNALEEKGFKINPERRVCKGIKNVIEYIKEYTLKRDSLPYDIDG
ncbi:MAG: NAD(P)H-hydrate epimerase, partial [Christensenellaceae bacterium]|nr:NAD(P)H-hydrate epimerase [Christensenellaceae bacterium]